MLVFFCGCSSTVTYLLNKGLLCIFCTSSGPTLKGHFFNRHEHNIISTFFCYYYFSNWMRLFTNIVTNSLTSTKEANPGGVKISMKLQMFNNCFCASLG